MSATANLPRISIVTPSLNQSAHLEKTIRSVLEQGYPRMEYLIIDGGSTDGSVQIIEEYADKLAYWVSEPDKGQAHAINKGLARATGEIFAYINSDDWYLPGALEAAGKAFAGDDRDQWICGNIEIHNECEDNVVIRKPDLDGVLDRPLLALNGKNMPQPACFWQRALFETQGLFREDLQYTFDTEFQTRLLLAGRLPVLLDHVLAGFLVHPGSKTGGGLTGFQEERGRFFETFREQLTPAEIRQARFIGRTNEVRRSYNSGRQLEGLSGLLHLLVHHPVNSLIASWNRLTGLREPVPALRDEVFAYWKGRW